MAVASNAIYGTSTVATAPYVSSSAYYGYVPLCRRESGAVGGGGERAGPAGESLGQRCSLFDSQPMETDDDDDGYECSAASRGLSNHCLIPEANARHRLQFCNAQQHCQQPHQQQQQQQQQQYHQPAQDADALRRRNRKRSNAELETATQLKKFREGGGNGRVYYGTGSTKDSRLAEVRDQPAPLPLAALTTTVSNRGMEEILGRIFGRSSNAASERRCCRAAGNRSLISNADCPTLLSNNGSKSTDSSVEYERILFETHGCSVYHQYRLQLLDDDCIEAEF